VFSCPQCLNKMKIQAYDNNQVFNLQIQSEAADWAENGKITPPQYEVVKTAFPVSFKQGNVFQRIGLFLFTAMGCLAAMGFLGMILSLDSSVRFGIFLIIFSVLFIFLTEKAIENRHWYRFGSDNALCYAAALSLMIGLVLFIDVQHELAICLICLPVLTIFAVRYGDPILAIAAFYVLLYLVLDLNQSAQTNASIIGFTLAVTSFAVYLLVKKADWFYWEDCFTFLEIASLVALYGSLNYIVIDELQRYDAPNSLVFAITTAILPLIYLYFGIKNRDRILWILGGLAVAASIMTYRHYFSVMPIEWACTLAGLALLGVAFGLMKYLKTPRNGIVYAPKRSKTSLVETLIMNQIAQQSVADAPQQDERFGGGKFDGGGAGIEF
jgi:hypothetical protein